MANESCFFFPSAPGPGRSNSRLPHRVESFPKPAAVPSLLRPGTGALRNKPICGRSESAGLFNFGFTVTDLLVTVALVLLLSAVAISAATTTRNKSRLARCTANLQQVNRAVLAFCNDNNQTLPTVTPADQKSLWWWYKEQVKRYAGLTGPSSPNDTVFACPEDRGYSDPKPFYLSQRFDYGSYVFNGITMENVPNIAGWQLSSIKHPTRTLLVMEWTAHGPLSWHRSKTGKRNMPFYCGAESVAGFVDGHVSLSKIYYDGFNAAYTQDPIEGYDYQYSGD
jgi:Tfp pilus assembly protein PilE